MSGSSASGRSADSVTQNPRPLAGFYAQYFVVRRLVSRRLPGYLVEQVSAGLMLPRDRSDPGHPVSGEHSRQAAPVDRRLGLDDAGPINDRELYALERS